MLFAELHLFCTFFVCICKNDYMDYVLFIHLMFLVSCVDKCLIVCFAFSIGCTRVLRSLLDVHMNVLYFLFILAVRSSAS